MPILIAWLGTFLRSFFMWALKRLAWLILGGGALWAGWETGLLQPILKAFFLMLFDLLIYVLDRVVAFFAWVITEQQWEVPNAYTVMGRLPEFSLQVLGALGVWNQLGLLLSVSIFKWFARIFTLRLVFK